MEDHLRYSHYGIGNLDVFLELELFEALRLEPHCLNGVLVTAHFTVGLC